MKVAIVLLSTVALAGAALAQSSTSTKTPGHEMQRKGSKAGTTGASGYSPGHEMQAKGAKAGSPGASGYAPSQTTGSASGTASSHTKR
ncbi:hypothetical protein JQ612_29250 [Bradyrhizobium manausense]|uniref:hypothetical protein n=1 Tax=Bradyrhizobium manausense TaxID=989370 RepID=UPI001BA4635B|nr:hypothetical protein [Bradyrhizobium manausense]MBR0685806.1 hypothetical protein [Bradyrhizobium manausense]MBR0723109.1 hypothetical protein [Bradyrhizobium manausense]MBR0837300.1 hypothetical protein [Bradyrhizobium manausense]